MPMKRSSEGRKLTPVGAIVRGLVAGAVGTAAMDAVWFARYKRDGGESGFSEWEFTGELESWDDAPAPAQVGKRFVEGLFQVQLSPEDAGVMNNITHWLYGMLGGMQYGIVAGSLPTPRVWYGLPFGASVWGAGYVVLPAMKLYQPIWEYDTEALAKDLSAHLVYGLTTAAALRLLGAR